MILQFCLLICFFFGTQYKHSADDRLKPMVKERIVISACVFSNIASLIKVDLFPICRSTIPNSLSDSLHEHILK
jgi:hypothetical protein